MISIATHGLFWPQAGHGVLSDASAYGVNEWSNQYNFKAVNIKKAKLSLIKLLDKNKKCELKPKLKILLT